MAFAATTRLRRTLRSTLQASRRVGGSAAFVSGRNRASIFPASLVSQDDSLVLSSQNQLFRRSFATGTRGSRGHGWYVNYRAGKGGRHLQGEYFDRDSLEECQQWNDSILELGCQRVYLDVVLEPRSSAALDSESDTPALDLLSGEKHRLLIDTASTVMPETSKNFVDLCSAEEKGYTGSLLYRIEANVGLCGGDVLTNTGKAGKAAQGSPIYQEIEEDPLAMWHLPGTVTMHVATVGRIDSRFILCTQTAQHLDGIYRAFGCLTKESLSTVQDWTSSLITKKGLPTAVDLIVVGSGVLEDQLSATTA